VVWWLVGALVLIGVVLLGLVCAPVLRRLDGLHGAAERLRGRADEALAVQAGVAEVAARAEAVQEGLARIAPKDS
jgi:hypothetical protein